MTEYQELQNRLASGWNTWNTRSVLSYVCLPEGLAVQLGVKEYAGGRHLREALIGRFGAEEESIHPGPRTYDGTYTELNLRWRGIEVLVQSAVDGEDQTILVTPIKNQRKPAALIVEAGVLWNRPGRVERQGEQLVMEGGGRRVMVGATISPVEDPAVSATGPYLALPLSGAVGVYTGPAKSLVEIQALMAMRKHEWEQSARERFGELSDAYAASQTCLAWDTVYEPTKERVVSTVSRLWNCNWGGYVIFDWDTYFAALIASVDNRDLAYANAVEITRAVTANGFVPNFEGGTGKSEDRSQPPVGSMVVNHLYKRFGDRWLVEEVFDTLLGWNRWWPEHRCTDGLLCWGSDPCEPIYGAHWETEGVNDRLGAALESGLDNSPMYDEVPFDPGTHQMRLADVGLTGLYVMDCDSLAELADSIGRTAEAQELRERGDAFSKRLASLWDEESGIFLNRRTDTGESSTRLSPTNFYALLGRAATPEQAERMIREHFYNPDEFWGDWIMPSIARNDPAYPEQFYWRGRIWAPMNLLVYLGLRRYRLDGAVNDLVEKSKALILKEWLVNGHVHENYNADTGEGCDSRASDKFYHWGGLLGWMALDAAGF